MNKEQFLNKEIINKNNERGLVVSFDDEHIVIKYENEERTYCPDVAFKNKSSSIKRFKEQSKKDKNLFLKATSGQ